MASLDHSSNVVSLKLRNFLYRLCHFHYFIILPVFYAQKSIVLISQWQWHVDNRRSNHSRRTRKGRPRQQRPVDPIRKSWPKPNWRTSVVFAWLKCLTPRRTSSISKASIRSRLCQTASRKRHKMTVKPTRTQWYPVNSLATASVSYPIVIRKNIPLSFETMFDFKWPGM